MIAIGADIGGTSMRLALFHNDQELGRADGPGGSMRAGEGSRLARLVADLCRPLLAKTRAARADVLVVGAAGAGHAQEREELRLALEDQRLAWRVVTTSDAELARMAAFGEGPGILLIAGTGSIVVARDTAGAPLRAGGLGWRMGDQGSGYWLGARGLQAVGAMHDHLGPVTHLAEALPAAVGAQGIAGLVRWSVSATPAQVAGLAPQVLQSAADGDPVARAIRDEAVEQLVALVMGAGAGSLPVALTGGLLAPGQDLRDRITAALTTRGVAVQTDPVDPCRAATGWR